MRATQVINLPTGLAERVTKQVNGFERKLSAEPDQARAAIREICGQIPVTRDESGKFPIARIGLNTALLKAIGGTEMFVVAGARFGTHRLSLAA